MSATLYRSREQALIGGVCGGLAVFLGVNPAVIRLIFILLIFGRGIGVLLYLFLWIMIPLDGQVKQSNLAANVSAGSQEIADKTREVREDLSTLLREPQAQLGLLVGIAMIFMGVLYLIPGLHLDWLDFNIVWPLVLIMVGLALLLHRQKGENSNE